MEKWREKLNNLPKATQLVNEKVGFEAKFKSVMAESLCFTAVHNPQPFPSAQSDLSSCTLAPDTTRVQGPGLCSLPSAVPATCQGEGQTCRVARSRPGRASFVIRGFWGQSICSALHPWPFLSLCR